jgi:hypothetical protein
LSVPLPICYLNGTYLPLSAARISPLDRGFLFDGAAVGTGRPGPLFKHMHAAFAYTQKLAGTPAL